MILTLAVVAGLIAGWLRARLGGGSMQWPELRYEWLVFVAVIPQLLAFHFSFTRSLFADNWASTILVLSQTALLFFVWGNFRQPGMWMLALGLGLNLLVVVFNGGLMPISPKSVSLLYPHAPEGSWEIGSRLGYGKDIVLTVEDMVFPWLADRFLTPSWFPYRVAFSLGDVFIAIGAYRLLWASGENAHDESLSVVELSSGDIHN